MTRRYSIPTDTGDTIDAAEVADMAPTKPHVAGECIGDGCWACLLDVPIGERWAS